LVSEPGAHPETSDRSTYEVIVTTFTAGAGTQTLPIWIFSNYSRPNQLPLVDVASVLVLLLSVIPVYIAARITSDPASVADSRG